MQFDRSATIVAVVALAVTIAFGICITTDAYAAEPGEDYDEDKGTFWSLSCRFIYSGSGADTVSWDFGDGSPSETGMNVDHTFPAPGDYIITQTATNSVGETITRYHIELLGYPTVTYDLRYDGLSIVLTQTGYNMPASIVTDPVRDGYTFAGWYSDASYRVPYDFSAKVISPVTIYAKWLANTSGDNPDEGSTDDDSDDSSDDERFRVGEIIEDVRNSIRESLGESYNGTMIGIMSVGGILVLIGAYMRRPVVVIIAVAAVVIAGVLWGWSL